MNELKELPKNSLEPGVFCECHSLIRIVRVNGEMEMVGLAEVSAGDQ